MTVSLPAIAKAREDSRGRRSLALPQDDFVALSGRIESKDYNFKISRSLKSFKGGTFDPYRGRLIGDTFDPYRESVEGWSWAPPGCRFGCRGLDAHEARSQYFHA